ncbi:amidohydrolase family protein [Microlunatus sp. GCM10028923]|uniref:metal-dependent hydrolase family protein n=1 Tax=Microlunatus sp. GCM10028923 TaxID=3273400 RepID=UPI0036093149
MDAQGTSGQPVTVLHNVRVFDSRAGRLGGPGHVVVEGELITAVGDGAPPEPGPADRSIDCGGRVLLPGLIDAHWHASLATVPLPVVLRADPGYLLIVAGQAAGQTLRRGFTTVRDTGGPSFPIKRAVDEGVITGPRIFPSGAMISQTSGHGDFRALSELPRGRLGRLSHGELIGAAAIADGPAEVLRAAREQLMQGASQLKLMAGGGVSSSHDPLDGTQFTEPELRAAVDAAADWGTYVMVHAYTPRSVQRAIRAGVRCIEHGQLLDDETVALMAEQQVWWSLQPFLDDEDAVPVPVSSQDKQQQVLAGTDTAYRLGRRHGVRIAWGSDTLFSAELADRQGAQLAKLERWYTPAEVLTMATATNAELLALSGPRNPYPAGSLGVVEPGGYADLLVVDGNPLEDLSLIADPETSFAMIMKNGTMIKNRLA